MDKELAIMLKIICDDMQKRRDNDLKEIDLTFSQLRVLLILLSNNGEQTQKEIENKLMISHSATHGIINRLIQKNYVSITENNQDKRHKLLVLTNEGKQKLEELNKKRNSKPNPFDVLDENDKKILKNIIKKLVNEIKKQNNL